MNVRDLDITITEACVKPFEHEDDQSTDLYKTEDSNIEAIEGARGGIHVLFEGGAGTYYPSEKIEYLSFEWEQKEQDPDFCRECGSPVNVQMDEDASLHALQQQFSESKNLMKNAEEAVEDFATWLHFQTAFSDAEFHSEEE